MRTLLMPLTLLGALLTGAPAQAQDTTPACRGTLMNTRVESNLMVPAGSTCTINNTEIIGNVLVGRGGSLVVRNAYVGGDISTAAGFARVALAGSIVEGNLRAEGGGSVTLDDSQVLGDVNISGNRGAVSIRRVTLNRDLNCQQNARLPTGTWLRVDGKQTGQCSRL